MACFHWEVKKPPGAGWIDCAKKRKNPDGMVLEQWLAQEVTLYFTKEDPSKGQHGFVWVVQKDSCTEITTSRQRSFCLFIS